MNCLDFFLKKEKCRSLAETLGVTVWIEWKSNKEEIGTWLKYKVISAVFL